jgi:hypothetical protein
MNDDGPLTPAQLEQALKRMFASQQEGQSLLMELLQKGAIQELPQITDAALRIQGLSDGGIQALQQALRQAVEDSCDVPPGHPPKEGWGLIDDSLLPDYKPPKKPS